ncbi:hypothetical protein HNQ94_000406 [Salirhabdus euzebyi]|uniref:Uncharacterized protein n=1 Tax=Salirhabdus euzebyi TaxID=394506 RepID=A0A841Q1X4_9BACI|nr:hypothetical protein [Salirhabdus euzebyi]MBB6451985.1 hypothetical protein [Salirhabdus euzebyi]
MSINKLIKDTLEPLGIPVDKIENSIADTYIVYTEYNRASMLNADDEEKATKVFLQVDVFSKGNYEQLVIDVKRLMKEAGFGRMFESETYEVEMKKFRKIIRFSYATDIE